MSKSYTLPIELWEALREAPTQTLSFDYKGFNIKVQITGSTKQHSSSPHPTGKASTINLNSKLRPPHSASKMKLQLLEDSNPNMFNLGESLPEKVEPFSSPRNTPAPALTPPDALRTHSRLPPLQPIDDFLQMVDEEEISFPPIHPLEKTQRDPDDEDEAEDAVVDVHLQPSESLENKAAFENAFLDDDFDNEGWLSTEHSTFRVLRTTDTPKVLHLLFHRLNTSLEQLNRLLPESQGGLPPTHIARAAGITAVLHTPIPFSPSPETPPQYHLVGQTREDTYVLLYQENGVLQFDSIPQDGGNYQIALVEGEELLTDQEITQLFKEGARDATPAQAEATARQVQHKLRRNGPSSSELRPLALSRPNTQKYDEGIEKSIPVNQRLLNRLDYNRNQDQEYLWSEELQPGVAVFRYNIATLYQQGLRLLEGVLLCIIDQKQYLVFDRRSKRSIALQPDAEQSIWLRHDENLA